MNCLKLNNSPRLRLTAEYPSAVTKGSCCCRAIGRRGGRGELTGRHMCFLSALQERLIEMNEFSRRVTSHQPTAGLAGRAHIVTPPSVAAGVVARFPPGWSIENHTAIHQTHSPILLHPACFFFAPGGSLHPLLSKTLTDLIPSSQRGERPR